jgi:hypothetical protein
VLSGNWREYKHLYSASLLAGIVVCQRADYPAEWYCMCDCPWLAWDVMYQENIGWRYLTFDLHAMTH